MEVITAKDIFFVFLMTFFLAPSIFAFTWGVTGGGPDRGKNGFDTIALILGYSVIAVVLSIVFMIFALFVVGVTR